jgi:hypothetical protein
MDDILDCFDELSSEYNKFQYYERRLAQQKQFLQKKVNFNFNKTERRK